MRQMQAKPEKQFTGYHFLAIMVAFFGVVISVNLLMAYYANASWSGIISPNTYVASQEYNIKAAEARKWREEGFKGDFKVSDSVLEYRLQGPKDILDKLTEVSAIFHRPVGERQDFTLKLKKVGEGYYKADHDLDGGQWIVDLAAIEDGKTLYHQAMRFQQPEN